MSRFQQYLEGKHESNLVLTKVREIIDSLYGKRADDMYSQALDDIKEKLDNYFDETTNDYLHDKDNYNKYGEPK